MQHYDRLKQTFEQHSKIGYTKRLLLWDDMVMMPAGAASYRAEAVAMCDQLLRKLLVNKKTAFALNAARNEPLTAPWDIKNLEWMEKNYQSAKIIPTKLLSKSTKANALAVQA